MPIRQSMLPRKRAEEKKSEKLSHHLIIPQQLSRVVEWWCWSSSSWPYYCENESETSMNKKNEHSIKDVYLAEMCRTFLDIHMWRNASYGRGA